MSDAYTTDVAAWSSQQAELLRRVRPGRRFDNQVDWLNIAEEIEAVGRSERSALRSHIATVLEHLIKLQASPATDPRAGWEVSIYRARADIDRVLADSPSLRPSVAGLVAEEMPRARALVLNTLAAYGEEAQVAIADLAFTHDQVLGNWFPGSD